MKGLLKQYCVRWINEGAGQYRPADPGCGGGDDYADLHGTDFIMATSKGHAINILREGRGQNLQIKTCLLTDK